jgi:hypothetical protein
MPSTQTPPNAADNASSAFSALIRSRAGLAPNDRPVAGQLSGAEHPSVTFGSTTDPAEALTQAQAALQLATERGDTANVTYYDGLVNRLLDEVRARATLAAAQPRHPVTGQYVGKDFARAAIVAGRA